jgi:hypothetical protein
MAAIACISPDDARAFSISLFRAMETLAHADAHLHSEHSVHSEKGEGEAEITTILFRASQVAHASCESALAHIEPFYDTNTEGTASCSCSCSCRSLVSYALKNADTVSMALEHASKNASLITSLPLSDFCGDEAMRAAIDAADLGAISLAVVLLSEIPFSLAPPLHQLVHHALSLRQRSTEIDVNTRIVCVLLTVPAIAASATNADTDGNTALMLASKYGHTKFVNALLACPTVVQPAGAVDTDGYTALMLASKNGHTETIVGLLACPPVVQSACAVNIDGFTALMLAAKFGQSEAVTALLACPTVVQSAGAVNVNGNTALMIASCNWRTLTVTALLACPEVVQSAGAVNYYGYTALMHASQNGHNETVTALLACPTVVQTASTVSAYGETAFMIAQRRKHDAIIALLSSFDVVI